VCLGWILFRARDLDATADVLAGLASGAWVPELTTPWIAALIALGLALHFLPGDWVQRLERAVARLPIWAFGALVGAVLAALNAIGPEGVAPFIYFQF
jgi:hypothetical protein